MIIPLLQGFIQKFWLGVGEIKCMLGGSIYDRIIVLVGTAKLCTGNFEVENGKLQLSKLNTVLVMAHCAISSSKKN